MRWTNNDTAAFLAVNKVGNQLLDAYQTGKFKAGLQDVMKEQPTQQFSEAQGQQLEDLSKKTTTDENGIEVPAYDIQNDGSGYTAKAVAGAGLSDAQIRPDRHSFAGRTQDKPFTIDQIADLRAGKAADYYMSHGRPEEAMKLQAQQLALRQGRRQDDLGAAQQGLQMATVENQYKTLKDTLRADVMAKKISVEDARRELFGRWLNAAESMPAYANQMLEDPETQQFLGVKDANYDKSTGGLILTDVNGNEHKVSKEQAENYRRGGPAPIKVTTLAEGAKAIGVDAKGKVKELASNPKAPDPTKNNAQMDDAAGVMTKLLDANKTMMTQFGGDESAMRERMVLLHNKNIGEFQRLNGRAPTLEEAAMIAEKVFDTAKRQVGKK